MVCHAVQKGKTKTPAQDRLQKIVKDRTAIAELLKNHTVDLKPTVKNVLPKNYYLHHESSNSQKSNVVVKCTNIVKPAQAAVGIVDCAKPADTIQLKWSNDFVPNENVSKIGPTTKKSVSFYLPENGLQSCQPKLQPSDIIKKGHDFQVQNRLKINNNSKIIGGKWLSFDLVFSTYTHTNQYL